MAQLPPVLDARYQILGPLGHGGMGTVFRALDREHGRTVALKTVDSTDLGDWFLDALRHEFRVLSALRHPNVVEVYDFGVVRPEGAEPAQGYFTEELLEGREFAAAFRDRPPEEWLAATIQVCRALEFLHSRGYVHGDIKPSNILVLPGGQVKLVDLGLASEIRARGSGEIRGTPAYLAPECFRGGTVDGRADLYALGVMLYEQATGRPPFRAGSPRGWMKCHCTDPAPPFPPGGSTPPFVEHLVFRLLEKDPRARFFRANDVLEAINRGLGVRHPAETAATLEGRIYSVDWVGRREVLTRLVETLLRVVAPRTGPQPAELLLIEGEPGMGKSRCLRELAWRAQLEGVTALRIGFRGVGHAAEQQPLRRVCGLLARGLPADAARRPAWVQGYEAFLESLERPAPGEGADPDKARPFMAGLVARAAAEVPLVLLLDDVDLAPEAALKDLIALACAAGAQAGDGPCRLLLCAASGGAGPEVPDAGAPAQRLLASLRALPGIESLVLPPLTQAESEQLGAGVLGLEGVPAEFAAWLHRASGGVPFWAEETLRTEVTRGRLSVGERIERWASPPEPERSERGEASRALSLLDDVARAFSPEEAKVAEALAVLGRPGSRSLLQAVAGLAVGPLRAAAERMTAHGHLRLEGEEGAGDALWFARGALARRLYGRIEPGRRAELHRRAAAAGEHGPHPWPQRERAVHLALGGARDRETSFWLEAAVEARGAGDVTGAETILVHLLSLAERPDRVQAYRPLAGLRIAQSRIDEADALGREMVERAAALAGEAGELLHAQGLEVGASCRARRGDIAGACAVYAEAYALLTHLAAAGHEPARPALARVAPYFAAACAETGKADQAQQLIVTHLAQDPPPETRAQFAYIRSLLLRKAGDDPGAESHMREGVAIAERIADPLAREATLAAMRFGLASVLRARGANDEALETLNAAQDAFHRVGQTISEITVQREAARLLLSRGQARAALERARRALRLAEQVANPHSIAACLVLRADARSALGEWTEAEDDLGAAIRISDGSADRHQGGEARLERGWLRVRMTRWSEAIADLEEGARLAEGIGNAPGRDQCRAHEARAWAGLGAYARARERLAEARGGAPARVALVEAAIALDEGDAARAVECVAEARRAGAGSDRRWELELGLNETRALLTAGRAPEARRALDAVRARAGELDLGIHGSIIELEAQLQARSHRATASLAVWQEAANFWERRRAPLRLAAAFGEACVQALALGDRALARAYAERALALWQEEEAKAAEPAREGFRALPAYARARERLAETGSRVDPEIPEPTSGTIEDKTVVLEVEEEEATPEPAVIEPEEDHEKDLLRAVIRIQRERSPEGLRKRLLDRSVVAFRARRGLLFLEARFLPGIGRPALAVAGMRFVLAEGEPGSAVDAVAAAVAVPASERRIAAGDLVFVGSGDGPAEAVVVPLLGSSGRPLGLLCLDWTRPGEIAEPVNVEMVPFFATHAAAALESTLRGAELEHDPATGLLTTPACRLRLRDALDRARKGGWPVSVLLAQVDGLDRVRARSGLASGDRWLRAIAEALRARAIETGRDAWAGRGEGDAFMVVLPRVDPSAGATWGREALALFARGSREGLPEGPPPEVSLALACFPADGDTPEALWFAARRRV